MTKYRKARGLLAGLAGIVFLLGGLAVASNMGFKFVPSVADGQNFNLSLPWNNNYTDAESLRADAGAERIAKFNANSTLTSWFGNLGVNFPLVKGEAYMVFAASGSGGLTPVIVGSHDPNYTMTFSAGEAYNASAPYHQTFTTADELLQDLRTNLGAAAIPRVSKFNANATLTSWFGNLGVNFDLDLGMGVIIFADADTGAYAWPHY